MWQKAVGICSRFGQLVSLCKNMNYASLDVRALALIYNCQGGLTDMTCSRPDSEERGSWLLPSLLPVPPSESCDLPETFPVSMYMNITKHVVIYNNN